MQETRLSVNPPRLAAGLIMACAYSRSSTKVRRNVTRYHVPRTTGRLCAAALLGIKRFTDQWQLTVSFLKNILLERNLAVAA